MGAMRARWPLLLVALAGCAGGTTRAVSAEVDALLRRGVEQRSAGRDAEALETFRAARARSEAPRVVAQLALALQANGRWVEAEAQIELALRATDDPWIRRHRAVLDEARRDIARRVGALFVGGNVDGATVRLDGADVATLPMREPVRVVAGEAVLEVRAAGHAPVSRRIVVRPSGITREVVRLPPLR